MFPGFVKAGMADVLSKLFPEGKTEVSLASARAALFTIEEIFKVAAQSALNAVEEKLLASNSTPQTVVRVRSASPDIKPADTGPEAKRKKKQPKQEPTDPTASGTAINVAVAADVVKAGENAEILSTTPGSPRSPATQASATSSSARTDASSPAEIVATRSAIGASATAAAADVVMAGEAADIPSTTPGSPHSPVPQTSATSSSAPTDASCPAEIFATCSAIGADAKERNSAGEATAPTIIQQTTNEDSLPNNSPPLDIECDVDDDGWQTYDPWRMMDNEDADRW